jgi:DNA-binding CsgD family transcriptional regulator
MTKRLDPILVEEYIRLCELFSSAWNTGFALLCIPADELLFVSSGFTKETGITNNRLGENIGETYSRLIHPKDLPVAKKVYTHTIAVFNKLHKYNATDNFIITRFNFRLLNPDGHYRHTTVVLKPAYFSKHGTPLLAYVAHIPEQRFGHERFILYNADKQLRMYYTCTSNKFIEADAASLGKIETRILSLTAQGYSESKIAGELNIKPDLVKYYKKSIYKKFHISTINEAVYIAIKNRLI